MKYVSCRSVRVGRFIAEHNRREQNHPQPVLFLRIRIASEFEVRIEFGLIYIRDPLLVDVVNRYYDRGEGRFRNGPFLDGR